MLDDAEKIIVALNSVAGEIKEAVDKLRHKGEKVGLLKLRVFRPFPYEEVRNVIKNAGVIAVMDRMVSFGSYGPLFMEIKASLNGIENEPLVYNRVYGAGGRNIDIEDIEDIFSECERYLEKDEIEKVFSILGVRGN